jgi:pilus assembly protein CpaC
MTNKLVRRSLATSVSAVLAFGVPMTAMAQTTRAKQQQQAVARVAQLPAGTQRPTAEVLLSIGEGELITLPSNAAAIWTSNPTVADVYVANPHQIHLYGKEFGEATVFATSASGAVIYATNVRVSQNITSIDRMLKLAMPEADIKVTTVGQIAVINGTVASPSDSEQAQRLVTSLLNPGVDTSATGALLKIGVVNRLRTATPLQVNLQVRFAEVTRSFVKNVGVNILTRDQTSGFQFGIGSGTRVPGTIGVPDISKLPVLDASSKFGFPAGTISLPFDPARGDFIYPGTGSTYNFTKSPSANTTLGLAGKLLGLDVLSAIDLGERIGQVTTLANPNLTALSGETATFLAGGEIPIPISQGLGAVAIEYKQYGVSLAFTPTVLADGRISLRVKPEVSSLDSSSAVTFGGTSIPGISTRRSETTIELGSGESMMIAGLLQNTHNNSFDKAPGLGDVPILGALFRSNAWQRNETELVIVITPYLVKPVNANQIVLPTDGYKAPDDLQRLLGGQLGGGTSGGDRPKPMMAPSGDTGPSVGAMSPVPVTPAAPAPNQPAKAQPKSKKGAVSAAPGFGL